MAAANRIPITISVDEAHIARIDEVAAWLRAAGMEVERSLGSIGAISGHVAHDRLLGLSQVPGVAAVERERSFQLPPPDAEVQ